MIDYDKLKIAHDIAKKISEIANTTVAIEFLFFNGEMKLSLFKYGCHRFKNLDELISYLECWHADLTQIKKKND